MILSLPLRSPLAALATLAALVALASVPACSAVNPAIGPARLVIDAGTVDAGPRTIDFARDIRPLMNRSEIDPTGHGCKHCHYPGVETQAGYLQTGLDLSHLGGLRAIRPATGKPVAIPYDPDNSAIVQKLRGTYFKGVRMPKNGPPYWTDADIQKMVTWIAEGAQGDDSE